MSPPGSAEVDLEVLLLEIGEASTDVFVPENRWLEEVGPAQDVQKPVHVEGRKPIVTLRELISNLMHLGGLVHRTTNEEDALSRAGHFLRGAGACCGSCFGLCSKLSFLAFSAGETFQCTHLT